ncbi:MAG: aromatic ring-hydroxylating dioxygenase subunit alpha [Pacificimonas sp.]|jgi:Rieske 2Fe-2S family protein|nr:aromatic ring-hydroxylating dioxygenase subunit alpha [Pacificimonas sp.]
MTGTLEASLPNSSYVDPANFEQEKEKLFSGEWFCAAREEDLPEPQTARVIELFGESIILCRLKNGELRAHYNVCSHRGTRLCATDDKWGVKLNGGIDRGIIRCPYHQWAYAFDGQLLSAPHLGEAPGFDKADYSLRPVGVGIWGGFVFLKLSPEREDINAGDIGEQLGKAPVRLGNYPLEQLKTADVRTYEVAANWKIVAENYNECYHCGGVHPELCSVVPALRVQGGAQLDWENGIPHREGAWTYTMTGTTNREPFDTLDEHERVRHKGELIYPNMMLSMSAEHGAAFFLWPVAEDRTRVECRFLFHPDEMEKDDFDPSDAVDFWDITNRQDWAVCERVQQGLNSRSFDRGYYAPMEDESLDIRRYIGRFFD